MHQNLHRNGAALKHAKGKALATDTAKVEVCSPHRFAAAASTSAAWQHALRRAHPPLAAVADTFTLAALEPFSKIVPRLASSGVADLCCGCSGSCCQDDPQKWAFISRNATKGQKEDFSFDPLLLLNHTAGLYFKLDQGILKALRVPRLSSSAFDLSNVIRGPKTIDVEATKMVKVVLNLLAPQTTAGWDMVAFERATRITQTLTFPDGGCLKCDAFAVQEQKKLLVCGSLEDFVMDLQEAVLRLAGASSVEGSVRVLSLLFHCGSRPTFVRVCLRSFPEAAPLLERLGLQVAEKPAGSKGPGTPEHGPGGGPLPAKRQRVGPAADAKGEGGGGITRGAQPFSVDLDVSGSEAFSRRALLTKAATGVQGSRADPSKAHCAAADVQSSDNPNLVPLGTSKLAGQPSRPGGAATQHPVRKPPTPTLVLPASLDISADDVLAQRAALSRKRKAAATVAAGSSAGVTDAAPGLPASLDISADDVLAQRAALSRKRKAAAVVISPPGTDTRAAAATAGLELARPCRAAPVASGNDLDAILAQVKNLSKAEAGNHTPAPLPQVTLTHSACCACCMAVRALGSVALPRGHLRRLPGFVPVGCSRDCQCGPCRVFLVGPPGSDGPAPWPAPSWWPVLPRLWQRAACGLCRCAAGVQLVCKTDGTRRRLGLPLPQRF